jgi:hypothetical protein
MPFLHKYLDLTHDYWLYVDPILVIHILPTIPCWIFRLSCGKTSLSSLAPMMFTSFVSRWMDGLSEYMSFKSSNWFAANGT